MLPLLGGIAVFVVLLLAFAVERAAERPRALPRPRREVDRVHELPPQRRHRRR